MVELCRCNGFRTALDIGEWALATRAEELRVDETSWTAELGPLHRLPDSALRRLVLRSVHSTASTARVRANIVAELFGEQLGAHFGVWSTAEGRVATCVVTRRGIESDMI